MRSPFVYFSAGQYTFLRLENATVCGFLDSALRASLGMTGTALRASLGMTGTALGDSFGMTAGASPLRTSVGGTDGASSVVSSEGAARVEESASRNRSHSSGRLSSRRRRNDECLSNPSAVISRYCTSHTYRGSTHVVVVVSGILSLGSGSAPRVTAMP